jgi:hypothetical protein
VDRLRDPPREREEVDAGVGPWEVVPAVHFHVGLLNDRDPELPRVGGGRAQQAAGGVAGERVVHDYLPRRAVDPELDGVPPARVDDGLGDAHGASRHRAAHVALGLRVDDAGHEQALETALVGGGGAEGGDEGAVGDQGLADRVWVDLVADHRQWR